MILISFIIKIYLFFDQKYFYNKLDFEFFCFFFEFNIIFGNLNGYLIILK